MQKNFVDYWSEMDVISDLPYDAVLRHRGASRPIYLRIETVNTCNNNCIICAYRDQHRVKAIMPMSLFRKGVLEYAEMGGFLSLTPLVGDVFLDRYLLERIRFLKSVPEIRSLSVTTNAAMVHRFDNAELAVILESFDKLSLSIYGTERMLRGIRRVLELSPHRVSLEFRLLYKKTNEELQEWIMRNIRPSLGPRALSDVYFINSVITDYASWGIYDSYNRPLPGDARWFLSVKQSERPQCLIPLLACIIFSSGNVSFCPRDNSDDTEELRLGSTCDQHLVNIYNSPLV